MARLATGTVTVRTDRLEHNCRRRSVFLPSLSALKPPTRPEHTSQAWADESYGCPARCCRKLGDNVLERYEEHRSRTCWSPNSPR